MKNRRRILTAVVALTACAAVSTTALAAEYTVAKGDCLWKIAQKQLGSGARWTEIYAANKSSVRDPNQIQIGQVLQIPGDTAVPSQTVVPTQTAVPSQPAAPQHRTQPTVTEMTLNAGSVTVYDYGDMKLHAYATGDALGDESYIVETAAALVGIELPAFTTELDVWKTYIGTLGKPMNDIFLCDHATGASYVEGMKVYGTQGAKESVESGSTYATTQGLFETFGSDFHGGDNMAHINTVVSGTVTVGGIQFALIDHGETYDLEIPAMNVVYTHMLGKTSHSIMTSTAHMDSMLAILRNYQSKGYAMILSSHASPEGQDAVTEKIAYVTHAKELVAGNSNAAGFTAAMKEAFPAYTGENYLDMTAGYLFPDNSETADTADTTNWAYAFQFNNAGIGTIYYAAPYFDQEGITNPATAALYTAEEIAAIKAGSDSYQTAPEGALMGMSVADTDTVYWYDAQSTAAITSHSDALALDAATGTLTTEGGEIVAEAMR